MTTVASLIRESRTAPHKLHRNAAICQRASRILARTAPVPPDRHGFHDPKGFMASCNASAARNRRYSELVRALVAKEAAR